MVGGRYPAINGLLQDDFLDVVRGEIGLGQRRPHMQAEFLPLVEGKHRADHQDTTGALVIMRACPNLAPGGARDEILKFFVERRLPGVRAIDPGIAKHLSALGHTAFVAFLVVHRHLRQARRKLRTVSVYCFGSSTFAMCAASRLASLAPLICFWMASPAEGGVARSCLPTMTKVGAVTRGLDAVKSMSRMASQLAM